MPRLLLVGGLVMMVVAVRPESVTAARPAHIELYSGWATTGRDGQLLGRVHRGAPLAKPRIGRSRAVRLIETLRALETRALARAPLVIEGLGDAPVRVVADKNGFFKVAVPPRPQPGLLAVSVRLEQPDHEAPLARMTIPIWDARPGLAVISDIDDTLVDTGVTNKLRMLKNTLFRSTWEVRAFPGAPRALSTLGGEPNGTPFPRRPVFFVSGSPWGLHDRLASFFERARFPLATLLLRRYSQESLDPQLFKRPHLLSIVDSLVEKSFVLVGDSGEKDPEIYRRLMRERPGRIAGAFIHLVTKEDPASPRFQGFRVFRAYDEVRWSAVVAELRPRIEPAGTSTVTP